MQYSRKMMRVLLATLLFAAVGCDEKKSAAPTVPPTRDLATAPLPALDLATAPAMPPSGAAVKPKAEKPARKGMPAPEPMGMMPHGSVEDGTLQYNPPPTLPTKTPTKK
jgi:hypothetical protein